MKTASGRFQADKNSWPYAFEHWLKVVGIKNGQTLMPMDIYALQAYRNDWEREGLAAEIYYSRDFQDILDTQRASGLPSPEGQAEAKAAPVVSLTTREIAATRRAAAEKAQLVLAPRTTVEETGPEQAARFLRALFAPYEAGWIELRCIRLPHNEAGAAANSLQSPGTIDPKTGSRIWRKCFPLLQACYDPAALVGMAQVATENCYETYLGVLPRGVEQGRTRKDVIYQAGVVWAELDFDKQGGEQIVMQAAEAAQPDILVKSGGGVHCYWLLDRAIDLTPDTLSRFEGAVRAQQAKFLADKTHDITRILRLPGSLNWKQKDPRRVELMKCP